MLNIVNKLPKHPTNKYRKRSLTNIEFIIVHHSGTTSGSPQSFADYHINKKRWPGIGYHAVIDLEGKVYKTNNDSTVSYHAGIYYNNHGIGIALVGNFDEQYPTPEQLMSLLKTIYIYRKAYGIYSNCIYGHGEIDKTNRCPGKNLDMGMVRTASKMIFGDFLIQPKRGKIK